MREVLFSGSAPTGSLTIGNYVGAIRQWKKMQYDYESYICIVDYHAITLPRDPEQLREKRLEFVALFLACGIDPDLSTVFLQSQNPDHAELGWILGCSASNGDLSRMTQFKDKSSRNAFVSGGLYFYPVLMAADILLYETKMVPIGDDQRQHLELCRNIAQRFNTTYGNIFTIPSGFIPRDGGRIKDLLDPSRKMDKSHQNSKTFISLLDTDDQIQAKLMKAKTDARGNFDIDDETEGIANLVAIMSSLTDSPPSEIADKYRAKGYGLFKSELAEVVIQTVKPVRTEYNRIRNDQHELDRLMVIGQGKAIGRSNVTLNKVKSAIGLR